MALQVVEPGGLGGGRHLGILLLGGGEEGNVHQGAVLLPDSGGEELAPVQEIVQNGGLFFVTLCHGLQSAVGQQVLEHLAAAVDGPAVGGIIKGVGVSVGLVAEIGGDEFRQILSDQILPDDDNGHASGAYVLLDAGPDQTVFADVAGAGEEQGGLVRHQNLALGVGQRVVGGAVDGLIFADVDVIGVVRDVQIGTVGEIGEVLIGGGGNDLDFTVSLGFGNGLFAPGAGLHIAGHAVFHQVHGNHGKLHRTAALNEEHLIVIRNVHQRPQIGFCLRQDLLKYRRAVAHLHNAHTAAVIVQHFGGNLLQNGLRHHSRSGGKIINTVISHGRFLAI